MKFIHALIIALAVGLTVSTVASANVHKAVRTTAHHAVAVATRATEMVGDEISPSPSPSESALPSPAPSDSATPSTEPTPTPSESASAQPANHGAAVSAVAKDTSAVATKTLPNGKTITNHGQAVAAVAKSDAGKPQAATSSHGASSAPGGAPTPAPLTQSGAPAAD